MNKLMGFLELQNMNLPSVPWKEYKGNEELQEDLYGLLEVQCFVEMT